MHVTDTGPGMPPEVLRRLYVPFFTMKGSEKGIGFGLAFSRSIVSAHGGKIEIQTAVGKGSTFTVVLPRSVVLPP